MSEKIVPLELVRPNGDALKKTAKVWLGIPSYDGRLHEGILNAVYAASAGFNLANIQIQYGSWITRNFNACLAAALNHRAKGITHFCLLHEDIHIHDRQWLEKMLGLMQKTGADVLSAVVPIKNEQGLTSTALDEPVGDFDPHWRVRRLTLDEVHKNFEPTFTHEKLLLNTGLMLIDLSKPWIEELHFEFEDKIIKIGDQFVEVGVPEDWKFSRDAREMGASLWATREIIVEHLGGGRWPNATPWGTLKTDQ